LMSLMSKSRKTYQIKIEGGDPFAVQIKANPPLIHDGVLTLWSGHLENEVHHQLMGAISETCNTVRVSCISVSETPLQKQLREDRARGGIPFFQAPECPLCFFYELDTENQCGLDDWDRTTIDTAMESEAAVKSRKACSLGK